MSSHIHELWEDLELQPLYPELNPDDISARVNAALDQDHELPPAPAEPRKTPMKRSLKSIVLFAAVLALMAGSVLAVAYRSGVLELFFPNGDTSQVEPYVQTALDTAENEDYRLRVDSCLYDGQNVYAVVTVEALNDQAAEDLMSNKVIAESHREGWGEDMVKSLMESGSTGPETFHCNFGDYYEESDTNRSLGGMGIHDLPNPDDHSRSWQIDIRFGAYQGLQEQPLEFWVDFMGKDRAVEIPLDNMAEPIRLTPNEEVTYNPYTGYKGILKEFILTPTSYSATVEHIDTTDYKDSSLWIAQAENLFFLRMKDGSILTRTQLGGLNDQFETVVDLSQVQSIIYGYTEFPVDGSPSFPAQLPKEFYPFEYPEILVEETEEALFFRIPVEELCQKLGADYQWDESAQTATISYRGVTLTLTVGQSQYYVDGVPMDPYQNVSQADIDAANCPDYIRGLILLEDGTLTAPWNILNHLPLEYYNLQSFDGIISDTMLVIP